MIDEEYMASLGPWAAQQVREDNELVEGMVEALRLIERRFGGEKRADAAKREAGRASRSRPAGLGDGPSRDRSKRPGAIIVHGNRLRSLCREAILL